MDEFEKEGAAVNVGTEQKTFPDRRYVGRRETFGFVMFTSAHSLNINKYKDRFVFDVLKINLNWYAAINIFNSVWDTINDLFIGVIVDKTRTRWGKFKPYLIVAAFFNAIMGSLFWMMPMFFNTDPNNIKKAIAYLLLGAMRSVVDTFNNLSETGLTSTITPHPTDRTRLITITRFWSNFIPTGGVNIILGILIDLINHKVISLNMKSTYVFLGVATMMFSALMALYFFIMVRERVVQSVTAPSVKDSLRTIFGSKPLAIIALSQLGAALQIHGNMDNYYIDVLGSASINNIVGIPGSIVSPMSYTYVNKLKKRFSTKFLWIVGGDIGDWLMGLVFFFGIIGGTGKNGFYQKPALMIPAIMLQETLFMFLYGVRKVIPIEITNETMDYCEWKYGYRTEGLTSVALGLANKLIGSVTGGIRPMIMKRLGYDINAGFGMQTDKAKFGLFAIATVIPLITGSFDSIVKLFYDLTGEKRERMYIELLASRAEKQRELSDGMSSDKQNQNENEI